MLDYQKIMNYRNGNNPFARHSGITITDMKNGYAKGEMEITEFHKNPIDSVHGGCLYTLADATGGAAAASHGKMLTTLNSSFEFLKPAINQKKLTCIAKEIKTGKRILVFEIKIYDENEKLIAMGTFTFIYIFDKDGNYIDLNL